MESVSRLNWWIDCLSILPLTDWQDHVIYYEFKNRLNYPDYQAIVLVKFNDFAAIFGIKKKSPYFHLEKENWKEICDASFNKSILFSEVKFEILESSK